MTDGRNGRARLRRLQRWAVVPFVVLSLRLVQVQVFQHDFYRQRAEKQWKHRVVLPAERGNIYDRYGRSLALSVTKWRIGVSGSLVDDADALAASLAPLLHQDAASLAKRIAAAGDDHVVLDRRAVVHRDTLRLLLRHRAVTAQELRSRIYPLGGVGASLLGFFREDPKGGSTATGLEQSLDEDLAGKPGEGLVYDTAGRNQAGLQELVRPRNGDDVVLTVDADVQALAERELAASVVRCHAAGGAVVVVEVATGDILAAADTPVLASRDDAAGPQVWDNFVFTGAYEPGSVFKIFTSASVLGRSVIDTATVYDCDDIQFDGYRIRNSEGHDFGKLSYLGAFTHSSNVYFARASLNLRPQEFYRDLVDFGFGSYDGIPYPGRTRGLLKPPSAWSGRTQATMAIGQEILVTPLQLAMAAAAVADGGLLMAPRLVREVSTKEGSVLRSTRPRVLRRVVTPELASLLRDAMTEVVRQGTGVEAAVDWTQTAGKTGTAEKAYPGKGYVAGKYMTTFLGMVPAQKPRLVVLTMLDEPDYAHHYAAQSAAPLFAAVVEEIGRGTDWLVGAGDGNAVLVREDRRDARPAPDLLYLPAAAARDAAAASGLRLEGAAGEGVVVAQVPAAGTPCRPTEPLRVTLSTQRDGDADGKMICPNLSGWSNREVRREAARLGVPLRCEGVGYVTRQSPSPGDRIGRNGIRVTLEAHW